MSIFVEGCIGALGDLVWFDQHRPIRYTVARRKLTDPHLKVWVATSNSLNHERGGVLLAAEFPTAKYTVFCNALTYVGEWPRAQAWRIAKAHVRML